MAITPLPSLDRTSVAFKTSVDTFFGSQLPTFSLEAEAARAEVVAKQGQAATSAANAATSEGNALSSKNAAATSKTDADTARNAAQTAQVAAELALDSFDDRYLGAKSAAPALDNDGNALITGALYWDTVISGGSLRVWQGAWFTISAALTGSSTVDFLAKNIAVTSVNGGQLAGMRNVIINGDMRIDQRNAGAAVAINNAGSAFASDRFNCAASGGAGTGTASVQRVFDGPQAGLPYSLKYTVTNAKTPAAGDAFYIYHPIEADSCSVFAFGTVGARSATLSFWVKSSIVGTYGGFLRSNTAALTQRCYVINYTINAANTWEYKTITVPFDTQFIAIGNGLGLGILFDLGSGSSKNGVANTWQAGSDFYRSPNCVNLISTLNATLQITGVQLEASPVATPFENRPVGLELALCQRYYEIGRAKLYLGGFGNAIAIAVSYKVTKRSTTTLVFDAANNPPTSIEINDVNYFQVVRSTAGAEISFMWSASAEL